MPQYSIPPLKNRPAVTFPKTIAANATWTSPVISAAAIVSIVVGLKIDQTGTLTISRYVDGAGLIPAAADITQALTANTQAWAGADDGVPFAAFVVSIANGAGSIVNVLATSILGNAS